MVLRLWKRRDRIIQPMMNSGSLARGTAGSLDFSGRTAYDMRRRGLDKVAYLWYFLPSSSGRGINQHSDG